MRQPRLAYARLAHQQHDAESAGSGAFEVVVEVGQLLLAPDHAQHPRIGVDGPARPQRRRGPSDLEGGNRLAHTLEGDLAAQTGT